MSSDGFLVRRHSSLASTALLLVLLVLTSPSSALCPIQTRSSYKVKRFCRWNCTPRTIVHASWSETEPDGCNNRLTLTVSTTEREDTGAVITIQSTDESTTLPVEGIEASPKTIQEAAQVFLFGMYSGPRVVLSILFGTILYRSSLSVSLLDPILFAAAVVFWWFQEHALHKHLLHSKFDWYGKQIHEKHHEKNYFHVSLDPAPLMVGWLLTAHALFRCILPLELAYTCTIGYAMAGLFYEWSHFIVHTKVRFTKGSYWQRK